MTQGLESKKPSTSLALANAPFMAKDVSSCTAAHSTSSDGTVIKHDIEHVLVEDDPRAWSQTRKTVILFIISGASLIAGLCSNIQNPANAKIQQELDATARQISLSLSLFILVQGNFPLVWSAVGEIKGRKLVYLLSVGLFIVGSISVALSKTIFVFIGMRLFQAAGSSAVITIGAATLADIYEPHQRGTMMGVYYCAPLLGPSIGPLLGGGLTQGWNWRVIFWLLAIWGAVIFSAFLVFFEDTFRKERSLTYQNILQRRIQKYALAQQKHTATGELPINEEKASNGISKVHRPRDVEAQPPVLAFEIKEIKPSLADVNPIPPFLRVLSRKNNLCILIPSGLLFAFNFSISYTCARTMSLYYHYDAMTTGLVLLSFGIGCILGSVLGGRWSDRTLARLKAANGGVSYPEMRLESAKFAMWCFPPAIIGYAWVIQQHVHIAAICVMLFLCGFCSTCTYASTLSYIIDANVGRSVSAVATNISFRGLFAFVAAEIAVPLQDVVGDAGLYSCWAGVMFFAALMISLAHWKGKEWRETSMEE